VGAGLIALGSTAGNTVSAAQSGFVSLEQKLSLAQDDNSNTGAKDNTQASSQELLSKGSLDDYSWTELKIIANDLSANGEQSVYYAKMTELMQSGSTKTFDTGDTSGLVGSKMRVRIIGICQDQKSDGSGSAGLTFQTTHALATPYQMNTSNTNSGGWGSTSMRTWLNSTVYNTLPDDLRENIVEVKKYYNPIYNSTSSNTLNANDYLFLLSMRELYNYSFSFDPWYEHEGTGASHDEQYTYYSNESVTTSNYSLLKNIYLDYNGAQPADSCAYWWLRTVNGGDSNSFWIVKSSGYNILQSAGFSGSVVPSFSL
jgi:hypothetical protein